jgi:hypothetical protein
MNKKKLKAYGIWDAELRSLITDKSGVITTIFEDPHISHCTLTFNNNINIYAASCDENVIGVYVERSKK